MNSDIKCVTYIHRFLFLFFLFVFLVFLLVLSSYHVSHYVMAQGANEEIQQLEKDIEVQKRLVEELRAQTAVYEKRIQEQQSTRMTLANQIEILLDQSQKIRTEIQATTAQVSKLNLELEKLENEIAIKNSSITAGKEQLAVLVRLINNLDQKSIIETLLLNDRFSEMFEELNHLTSINSELKNALADLMIHKTELEEKILNSTDKKRELEELALELAQKEDRLTEQQETKQILLDETRSSERAFQSLLTQAKQEQDDANYDIIRLQNEVGERLKKLQKEEALAALPSDFIWPVSKNTITTYFRDPEYPYRHIFEHPGIDIRASQGSTIKAAASGYVARAKDAGYGYSYIMLVHNNNLATVYGHVSCILVQEDTFVTEGQEIGCVGGLPGTKGAGRLTTGPHLHFEIRQNGIPVDPLPYLP